MKFILRLAALSGAFWAGTALSQEVPEDPNPGTGSASTEHVGNSPAESYFGTTDQIGLGAYASAAAGGVTTSPVLELTFDLKELARGLNYDPVKIYNYVRNEIDSELYFGLKKGPRMTLLEESGNDLDKAFLLAALLQIASDEDPSYSATIRIAQGLQTLPYYVNDAVTPDVRSLWRLDDNSMALDHSGGNNPTDYYKTKTPYLHESIGAIGDTKWADENWRRISAAFTYASQVGYGNDFRMPVPTSATSLTIRRFVVKATGLPNTSGDLILDPWAVKYEKLTPFDLAIPSIIHPPAQGAPAPTHASLDWATIVRADLTNDNLWRPISFNDRLWYSDVDGGFASKLNGWSMTLLGNMKGETLLGSLTSDQVFGRFKMIKAAVNDLDDAASSLIPASVGGSGYCSVNKLLAWRLNLTLDDQPSVDVYFPSLAGRRLSVHTENNLANFFLSLGVENQLFGADFTISELSREPLGTARTSAPLTSAIRAPFVTEGGQTASISYARNAESGERLRAAHSIIYGFSPSGGMLRARQARLDEILQQMEWQYPGSTTGNSIAWSDIPSREEQRPIVLETLNIQGLDWLRQTNLVRQAAGDVFGANLGKLVSVGRMSQNSGYFIDIYQQLGASIARDGNYNEKGGEIAGLYSAMLLESALEHSIIEQASSSADIYSQEVWRPSGASTVNIFHAAHKKTLVGAPALGVLVKNTANNKPPTAQTTPLSLSQDPYETFFAQHQNSYGAKPWAPPPIALAVFQDKSAFPVAPGPNAGSALFGGSAYLSAGSIKMTAGGANGGYSILNTPIDTSFIFEADSSKPGYFDLSAALKAIDLAQPSYGLLDLFGADPVNVASGAFEHSEIDLTLGSGEAPMGLSFKRDYSSSRARHDVSALGFGWTHNWDIRLTENTHSAAALGATIPRQMAPFILSLRLLHDTMLPPRMALKVNEVYQEPEFYGYYKPSIDTERWMVINAIAKWAADQVTNNAVTVTMGNESETFTRNPDGTYDGGSGSTMTFSMTPSGVGTLKQRHGNTIEFTGLYTSSYGYRRGRATKITGPHGQYVTLTWGQNGISEVTSVAGPDTRKLVFNYATTGSKHLTSVDEKIGSAVNRSVVFTHQGGNLVSSTDPENLNPLQPSLSGGSTTYGYSPAAYGSAPCCLSYMGDPMGRDIVRNEYDAFCRVTRQDSGIIERDNNGKLLKPWIFRYAGVLTDEVDPLGGTKTYYYDHGGRLVKQTDALGYASLNFYDAEDRVVKTVDPRLATIETDYDRHHNPIEIREYRKAGVGTPYITLISYDALHRPLSKTDPLNRLTEFTYPTGSTAADPETVKQGTPVKTTTYEYADSGFAKGLMTRTLDDAGVAVTNTYTAQGYLETVTQGGTYTAYSNFTPAGDPQTVTDGSNQVDSCTFNRRRQPITHTRVDATNPAYTLSETSLYESTGRLALESTATGRSGGSKRKAYEYLSTGKPTYTRYAGADGVLSTGDDTFELNVYDEREWVVKAYDVNGNVTETNYLANGWTSSSEMPVDPKLGTRVTSSEYDIAGRVTKATDVLGRDSITTYDEHVTTGLPSGTLPVMDRSTVTDPASFTTTQWKDPMGNVRATVDKRDKVYRMTYDDWDRVTQTLTPGGRQFNTSYWQDGRVAQVSKGDTGGLLTTQNIYNAGNRRLSTVVFGWPAMTKMVTYDSYDGRGNLLQATENTKTLVRTYDSFNRVRTFKNADGWMIGYEYYNDGMLRRIYYPDSATDTNPFDNDSVLYNYDQQGRLLTITDWAGRVTTYNWRTDGRLNSITRPNGTVRQLLYDSLARVIGFTERSSTGTLIHVQRLEYRKTDDLASSYTYPAKPATGGTTPVSITSATYGDDNNITAVNSVSNLPTDSRGNLTSAVLDSSGTPATLAFDERDRLTGVDSALDTTYSYDLEGHRRSMTHAGSTTNYVFDPHGGSLVRMLVRIDSTGKKTRYVYGVGLDYEVDQSTAQAKYYHYDFTGGTAAITNQSGTVTDRFFYTPYGQVTHATGTSDTPFKFGGFLGIITDPNGLLSMRARFYSPVLSRFISMDPAKFEGGLNWYAYATGNPLTLGDPTGFGSESTLDAIQTGLSALGMVPVVGFAFDLVNAGISVARGNYADAALNMFSAIPGIGDVAGGMKLGSSAFKATDGFMGAVGSGGGLFSRGAGASIDDIVRGLDGVTAQSTKVADGIKSGAINVNVLSRWGYIKEAWKAGGAEAAFGTRAFSKGDSIYLRGSSKGVLGEAVHEGTHVLDKLSILKNEKTTHTLRGLETRAWSAERQFNKVIGGPSYQDSYSSMRNFIRKNYPRQTFGGK